MFDQSSVSLRWDIFCRVIDNLGDAGVCWRLITDLASRGEWVRLYIDQPQVLKDLIGINPVSDRITVLSWPDEQDFFKACEVADVVVEAFACDPPISYIQAMSQAKRPIVWINLEYLTAEKWVESCHCRPSPHPQYQLTKHFFFPGFTRETGGLLRELGLISHLEEGRSMDADEAQHELKIFLFSYLQPAINTWLDALESTKPTFIGVAPCPALLQIDQWVAAHKNTTNLKIKELSFVPQIEFDKILSSFDILFVRGEDSFVRGQWAEKPIIWHIYPQDEDTHLVKLKAFYDLYLTHGSLTKAQRDIYWRFVLAWNSAPHCETINNLEALWTELLAIFPAMLENARAWRRELLKQDDLVSQLRDFVSHLVKS